MEDGRTNHRAGEISLCQTTARQAPALPGEL